MKGRYRRGTAGAVLLALISGIGTVLSISVPVARADTGTTELISSNASGASAPGRSGSARVSGDGRFVAFSSAASLSALDTNSSADVYVRDRRDGTTALASIGASGVGNSDSTDPQINADGTWIAFVSSATNLVAGDGNGQDDIFARNMLTGEVVLVSRSGAAADGRSYYPSISGDGSTVVFTSEATNLEAGDRNGVADVFSAVIGSGTVTRISPDLSPGVASASEESDVNADGSVIVFSTFTAINSYDFNAALDVYRYDVAANQYDLISRRRPSEASFTSSSGNSISTDPAISADGRTIAFLSLASDLVYGDANNSADVFFWRGGSISLASVTDGGRQADQNSLYPGISADGRYITFTSTAALVAGKTTAQSDVFVRDSALNLTTRVSVGPAGAQTAATAGSYQSTLSTDGRVIAFTSSASTLAGSDTNGLDDVFVHVQPIVLPTSWPSLQLQTVDSSGKELAGEPGKSVISGDGRWVAFATGDAVTPDDTNNVEDVYVRNRITGAVTRVSTGSVQGDGASFDPSISADGRYVAFTSAARFGMNVTFGAARNVFRVDRDLDGNGVFDEPGTVSIDLISVTSSSNGANCNSGEPSITEGGSMVTFQSCATDLVGGTSDTNSGNDIFARDLYASPVALTYLVSGVNGSTFNAPSQHPHISGDGSTVGFETAATNAPLSTGRVMAYVGSATGGTPVTPVSVTTAGVAGNQDSNSPVVSIDGRYAFFSSDATNLVAGDTNGVSDVFVRDRDTDHNYVFDEPGTVTTKRLSVGVAGQQGNGPSTNPVASPNGRFVAFQTNASTLTPLDTETTTDVVMRDRDSGNDGVFDQVDSAIRLVSATFNGGNSSAGGAFDPSISADGRLVAFRSNQPLTPDDGDGDSYDIFLRDLATTPVDIASAGLSGERANGFGTDTPSLSAGSRFVSFRSYSTNLTPAGSTYSTSLGLFVDDRETGVNDRIDVSTKGDYGLGDPSTHFISRDGRYVAFSSVAGNLAYPDGDAFSDVFLRDRASRTTIKVTNGSAGGKAIVADGPSFVLGMTSDARYIVFKSAATNLVAASTDTADDDLFVFDRITGLINAVTDLAQSGVVNDPMTASISDDGARIAFSSTHAWTPGVTPGIGAVYLVNRTGGGVLLISRAPDAAADGDSTYARISGNGAVIAFQSSATNLVPGDTNARTDVFATDVKTRVTERVSVTSAGAEGNGPSVAPAINGDGRIVGFTSDAKLVSDTLQQTDVYLRDRALRATTMVSRTWTGAASYTSESAGAAEISLDSTGTTVAFSSDVRYANTGIGSSPNIYVSVLPPLAPAFNADVSNLNMTVDVPTVGPGASSIPITSIPIDRVPALSEAIGKSEIGKVKLDSTPISSIPISSIPISSIPISSITYEGARHALDEVLLSSVPIDWKPILAGTSMEGLNLNALTLKNVFDDPIAKARFDTASQNITLGQFGTDRNLLRGTSVISALLGSTPISSIPVPGGAASWCSIFTQYGYTCSPNTDESKVPMIAFDIAGAPISSIPISSIPISSIPLVGPISSIPISSIPLVGPISSIPISSIANPNSVVDCSKVDCAGTATIKDAKKAGAIRPGATIKDLAGAFGDITFGQVIVEFLARSDFPWEKVAVDDLQDIAGGPSVGYNATYQLSCQFGMDVTTKVTAPPGFQVVNGSSRFTYRGLSSVAAPNPQRSGNTLTWHGLPGDPCATMPSSGGGAASMLFVQLTFRLRSSSTLGTYSSALTVVENGQSFSRSGLGVVDVVDTEEPNDTRPTATPIQTDNLILGHISHQGDEDLFTLALPPGRSHVYFSLSSVAPAQDYDLLVYAPQQNPLQSSPISSIPISSIPVEDNGADFHDRGNQAPETLADVPISSIPLLGPISSISANRGSSDERAQMISSGAGGSITIRVTGYNGAHSTQPYVLRAWTNGPPPLPVAPPRVLPFDATPWSGSDESSTTGALPGSVQADRESLFIVNKDRLIDQYGSSAVTTMLNSLDVVVARADVKGAVLNVDGNSAVRTAFAAWDANPNSIPAANDIVRAINDVISGYRTALPHLKHIVLLGPDEVVPFARVPDMTMLSNEIDEAADIAFTTDALTKSNATYASPAQGQVLTNDAYGTFTNTPWLGRELFLPDISVARLVETPEQIDAQLRRYVAADGLIDAKTALVTGYDFLSDGATEIAAQLGAKVGSSNVRTLNDNSWNRENLISEFTGRTPMPQIASVNAHYSHYLAQPAVTPDQNGLFSTADIPAPPIAPLQPAGIDRILFTVGCHAGLNIPDSILKNASADQQAQLKDWADTWAGQTAAIYWANTGFGYGDTQAAALSERLAGLFAKHLNDAGISVGEAAVRAKHEYFESAGNYGVYDEKVLIEMSMYGLPFWHTGAGVASSPPSPPATVPDGTTGLATATITISPTLTRHDADRGTYWSGPQGVHTMHYRPVLPLVTQSVSNPGVSAHGTLITGLTTSDVPITNPYLFRPTVDNSAHEPEVGSTDQIYPANLVTVARSRMFGSESATLDVIAGQYRGNVGPGGSDVMRLVDTVETKVAYDATSAEFEPPTMQEFHVTQTSPTSVRIYGRATDASGVKRFAALYHVGSSSVWQYVELVRIGTSDAWVATATVPGQGAVEVLGQAQDAHGNVMRTTNKALLHPAVADTAAPDIEIVTPSVGRTYKQGDVVPAQFFCSDSGSGVSACSGTVASGSRVDTSTVGVKSFVVAATDGVGNAVSKTVRYVVGNGPPKPPVDVTPPKSSYFAASDVLVVLPTVHADTVSGRVTDDLSGVSSITIKYVPLLGGAAYSTKPALSCDLNRVACTWKASAPTTPGRYEIRAVATDIAGNIESPGAKRTVTIL